jgi:type II secretory pathway component PulM
MNQIRQLISDAGAAFGRLSPRERGLVGLAAGVLLVFVIVLSTVSINRSLSRRESRIQTKLEQLEEISQLTGGFRAAEQQRADLERRLRGNQIRLFTYLDDLARKQGVEIGGMNDRGSQPAGNDSGITESSVEVNFMRISLDKLVRFLQEVESGSGLVKVTKLQIRPRSDQPVIDAWLTVTTYQLDS